jgi:hypothetical protein
MTNKHKHLEFIQAAIGRMAANLFLLKGWAVTLTSALFALAARDAEEIYFLIAFFPILIFWALDGYFLSQERRFRALYDHVRRLSESEIDFSMSTDAFKADKPNTWRGAMLSRTLLVYYVGLCVTMIVVMMVIYWKVS